MKIRTHSRIVAIALALVMILPLISIPAFADETATEGENQNAVSVLFSADFENYTADAAVAADDVFNLVQATNITAKKTDNDTYIEYAFNGNGDKNNRVKSPALSYKTTPMVVFEENFYVSSEAVGVIHSQYTRLDDENGNRVLNWPYLLTIVSADNSIKVGGATSTAKDVFADDTWFNTKTVLDLANGVITLYVNDKKVGQHTLASGKLCAPEGAWVVAKTDTSTNATTTGFLRFDDLKIYSGIEGIVSDPYAVDPITIDFENFEVGAEPTSAFQTIAVTGSTVSDKYGSKAWEIKFERPNGENKLNIDLNPYIKNPKVSYDKQTSIVFESDYFFEPDATGRIQTQFQAGKADNTNPAKGNQYSYAWLDLYQITFGNGTATIHSESGANSEYAGTPIAQTAAMACGKWNTVSVVVNLVTGMRDFYVNGVLVIEGMQLIRDGGYLTNITLNENKMVVGGKVNKYDGAGTYQVDNIKFFVGDAPSESANVAKEIEDFSDYKWIAGKNATGLSVPKLATFKLLEDDNMVVSIPMAAVHSNEKYALLRADGKKVADWGIEWDGNVETPITLSVDSTFGDIEQKLKLDEERYVGFYYAYDDTYGDLCDGDDTATADLRYYLVTEDVAEVATALQSGQVGVATKFGHGKYSYKSNDKIVLSADYYIEPGSKGVIESQFESFYYDVTEADVTTTETGSWIQLYYFDLATGRFEGLDEFMKIGAWNNVKVIMDLDTGVYDMFLNGEKVKTEEVGKTNLTIGQNAGTTWSVAKIQRQTTGVFYEKTALTGELLVDNVGVSTKLPTSSNYGDDYLTDDAYFNSFDELVDAMADATVRFENPNGLRFATVVNEERLAELLEKLGENALVEMGMIIAPHDYVLEAGAFTKDALAALDTDRTEANYLDFKLAEYFGGAIGADFGEGKYYTASIVEIKDANKDRDFAAIAYVTIQLPDGSNLTLYAKHYTVANVPTTAATQIANTESFDWTEEQLATLTALAGDVVVDSPLGNSKNPILVYSDMFEEEVDGSEFYAGFFFNKVVTITGETGFSVSYNGTLYNDVDGVVAITLPDGDFMNPPVFGIIGNGTYTVVASAPAGSMDNPIVIDSIENALTANVPEGGAVYYKWTATEAGLVAITTTNENASIIVNNVMLGLYNDPVNGAATAYVYAEAGDVIEIIVSTVLPENDDPLAFVVNPAGEVAFTVAINTERADAIPTFSDTDDSATLTLNAVPGIPQMYTTYNIGGKVFTIENANGIVIICNGTVHYAPLGTDIISFTVEGEPRGTFYITVVSNREEAGDVVATLTAPAEEEGEGSALVLGENTVTPDLEYTFTAPEAGTYVFTPDANSVVVYDYTTFFSDDPFEVVLEEGESVTVLVGTMAMGSASAYVNVAKKVASAENALADVAGEYKYTDPDSWQHRWLLTLNEDGTGTIAEQNFADLAWTDANSEALTFTATVNAAGGYDITIDVPDGAAIADGTYALDGMTIVGVTFGDTTVTFELV